MMTRVLCGLLFIAPTSRARGEDRIAANQLINAVEFSGGKPFPAPAAVEAAASAAKGKTRPETADKPWHLSEAVSLLDNIRRARVKFDASALVGAWKLTGFVARNDPDGGIVNRKGLNRFAASIWIPRRLDFGERSGHLSLAVDDEWAGTTYGAPGSGPDLGPADSVHYDWVKGPAIRYKAMGLSCYYQQDDFVFCELDASTIWFGGKQVDFPDQYYLLYDRATPKG